jgi:hypothetical protein
MTGRRLQFRKMTLEEIEGDVWREPDDGSYATPLVQRCHELRRVPLAEMAPGDLRFLLSQNIGAQWIGMLAVEHLEVTPLLEASLYPGDLLLAVLRLPNDFWRREAELRERVERVSAQALDDANDCDELFLDEPPAEIAKALEHLKALGHG